MLEALEAVHARNCDGFAQNRRPCLLAFAHAELYERSCFCVKPRSSEPELRSAFAKMHVALPFSRRRIAARRSLGHLRCTRSRVLLAHETVSGCPHVMACGCVWHHSPPFYGCARPEEPSANASPSTARIRSQPRCLAARLRARRPAAEPPEHVVLRAAFDRSRAVGRRRARRRAHRRHEGAARAARADRSHRRHEHRRSRRRFLRVGHVGRGAREARRQLRVGGRVPERDAAASSSRFGASATTICSSSIRSPG